MSDRTIAVQASRLTKVFGSRVVLRDVDLEAAEGEIVVLTGANGAGKTTLLRCLASLTRPTSGDVHWFGRPAGAEPAARRLVGMVPHQSCIYPHLTVRENVVFAARMQGLREAGRRADEWIAAAGLRPYAHRLATHLSRGMRRRVALARALVHDPPIVLMDEPFAGLDAEAAAWLVDLLAEFRGRSRVVCLATHDPDRLRSLAGRVFHLQSGRIEPPEPRRVVATGHDPGESLAA